MVLVVLMVMVFMVLVVSTEVCLVVCRYPEIASSCILNDFPESDSGVASYIYIIYYFLAANLLLV